jgi:hypothetical protein
LDNYAKSKFLTIKKSHIVNIIIKTTIFKDGSIVPRPIAVDRGDTNEDKVQESARDINGGGVPISVQTLLPQSSKAPLVTSGPYPDDWTSRNELTQGGLEKSQVLEPSFKRKTDPM